VLDLQGKMYQQKEKRGGEVIREVMGCWSYRCWGIVRGTRKV
jgi:hypothetical protein